MFSSLSFFSILPLITAGISFNTSCRYRRDFSSLISFTIHCFVILLYYSFSRFWSGPPILPNPKKSLPPSFKTWPGYLINFACSLMWLGRRKKKFVWPPGWNNFILFCRAQARSGIRFSFFLHFFYLLADESNLYKSFIVIHSNIGLWVVWSILARTVNMKFENPVCGMTSEVIKRMDMASIFSFIGDTFPTVFSYSCYNEKLMKRGTKNFFSFWKGEQGLFSFFEKGGGGKAFFESEKYINFPPSLSIEEHS